MKIYVEDLKAGMIASHDIFSEKNRKVPLVRKNTRLNSSMLERLKAHNLSLVYNDDDVYTSRQNTSLTQKGIYLPTPAPILTTKVKDEVIDSLETIFSAASFGQEDVHTSSVQIINRLDKVVEQLVDAIKNDANALININDLKSYDEYTFHHSLSVAILSIAIGQHMGFDNKLLNHIGKTALMHDIGKTAIPIEIIHKPSRLDDREYEIIKGHSPAGYDYLVRGNIGDEEMWMGVRHHHEKYDGTGYPDHCKGNEIPLESRIISVADVYDALTSNRPYRTPMQPSEAIEYLMGGAGSSFDFDIVSAFVNKVGVYAVGSTIELSNNRYAAVINNEHRTRPIVKLIDTGEVIDLFRDRACYSIVIKRTVTMEEILTLSIVPQ